MKTLKINCRIPLFPGFYNTNFEPDETGEIEYWSEVKGVELKYENFEWHNKQYEVEVAKNACDAVQELCPFILKASFTEIDSPREYNFRNDCVYADMEIDIEGLVKFISEDSEAWESHLIDCHRSRSGFTSFYSHNPKDWDKKTEDLDEIEVWSMLQFWFDQNEDEIGPNCFLEMCVDNVYISGTLKIDHEDVGDMDTWEIEELARGYLSDYIGSEPYGYGEFLLAEAEKTAKMFESDIKSELDSCLELAKQIVNWAQKEYRFIGWIKLDGELIGIE